MRSNNRRKRQQSNKNSTFKKYLKKIIIPTSIIFAVLILSTIFAITNSVNEKIITGVKINQIDVSRLTINEAYQKIREDLEKQVSKNLTVKQGEYETTISLGQLEVSYNTAEAVNDAYKVGRNTNIIISNYEVLVSKDGKNWTKAHSGKFDTTKENVIYFNESGSSDNSQLWTYNAKYVKLVAKGAQTISIAELDILGPPGDNIEIGMDNNDQVYKNGVGRLKSDYTYAEGKKIPKDSIIVMGEYTGDPAFNVPLILNEDNENFALKAQSILLANLPEDSQLGEVAKGNFIYWITPEQQENLVNGEVNIKGKSIKAELYRYNKLDSQGAPVGQRLVSDTFLVDLPENLNNLPIIDLNSNKARTLTNYDKVIEVDSKTTQATFENR